MAIDADPRQKGVSAPRKLICIIGATGYVGGRLLKALEGRGEDIRCLARHPEFLQPHIAATTAVVTADAQDLDSLRQALRGVDTAYYLVHSMASGGDFVKQDCRAAENFARAARENGVRRIIYLGGLGIGSALSPHLASRQQVGRIFAASGVPTIEFRASIVLGSGSLSFEMIRSLVDRLPVMVTPRWVKIKAQPIAIEDVIAYLVEALDMDAMPSTIVEIGGANAVSYQDIMLEYAHQRHLRRLMIPVPVLTPRLSSLWLGLVTPLYASVGRELIDSIRHETLVTEPEAAKAFSVRPRGMAEAIARALTNEDTEVAATRWSDAVSSSSPTKPWGGVRLGSRLIDTRRAKLSVSPEAAFAPVRKIGGRAGWYYGNALWKVRGLVDLIVGGPGMRRGRRDPERLRVGETVDFWRVEAYEEGRLLRLAAEMKLPGRAWLQFEVTPTKKGCRITQTAIFDPRGLAGALYWYALWPAHSLVFRGMLEGIVRSAKRGA